MNPLAPSTEKTIFASYKDLGRICRPNDIIYIDDGKIICLVVELDETGLHCEVKAGGELLGNRAMKLVGGKHESLPVLNKMDYTDISRYVE